MVFINYLLSCEAKMQTQKNCLQTAMCDEVIKAKRDISMYEFTFSKLFSVHNYKATLWHITCSAEKLLHNSILSSNHTQMHSKMHC